jgi:predicted AAA+ superfamily ATPase
LSARPELLRQSLLASDKLVIIDEVQKLPQLLDEVQLLIEEQKDLRFILTGSSARKLKRGGANMLGGRALLVEMCPLVFKEIENANNLDRRLLHGSLPQVYDSKIPYEDLQAYIGVYLKEEIQAEGLTRSIDNFSRFLEVAGLCSGQVLNYTEIANDSGLPSRTVQNYFQILQDTLIGYQVLPFQKTKKRKAIAAAKFYLFDIGVVHALMNRETLTARTPEYGVALEHLIFHELRSYLAYYRERSNLYFWRTHDQKEVDFIFKNSIAIEVKASERISASDCTGLRYLSEEVELSRRIIVCKESWSRKTDDGIDILTVDDFLKQLWSNGLK